MDLVKAQLHVAAGGKLAGTQPVERGHAVEARLNAEDPDRDFAPAPGKIVRLELPAGPGIRVDTGFAEGDTIPADFDSMIAKIIAYGSHRDAALGRLGRPLELKLRGATYRIRVARTGAGRWRVGIEAGQAQHTADVELDRFDHHSGQIIVNGRRFRLLTATHGPVHLVEVDGVAHRVSQ